MSHCETQKDLNSIALKIYGKCMSRGLNILQKKTGLSCLRIGSPENIYSTVTKLWM